jgi:uncharacterized protein HemX
VSLLTLLAQTTSVPEAEPSLGVAQWVSLICVLALLAAGVAFAARIHQRQQRFYRENVERHRLHAERTEQFMDQLSPQVERIATAFERIAQALERQREP